MMSCCPEIVVRPTAVTIVPGTSVTIVFPSSITNPPAFGKCFTFALLEDLSGITGTEETIINIDGVNYPLVDNWGLFVTSQMLRRPRPVDEHFCGNLYRIQFGAIGAGSGFYARRGFGCRKTTVNVVAVPVPPVAAPAS